MEKDVDITNLTRKKTLKPIITAGTIVFRFLHELTDALNITDPVGEEFNRISKQIEEEFKL